MALFGWGDTNRMLVDIPARYVPILGLPKGSTQINIKVSRGQGDLHAEGVAVERLMEYGIPAQAAKNLLGVGSKKKNYETLDDSDDPRYELLQLEELSPEEVAEGRGRTGMPTGAGFPTFRDKTWSIGDQTVMTGLGREKTFGDRPGGTQEGLGAGGGIGGTVAADPYGKPGFYNVSRPAPGDPQSLEDVLAGMRAADKSFQSRLEEANTETERRAAAEELRVRLEEAEEKRNRQRQEQEDAAARIRAEEAEELRKRQLEEKTRQQLFDEADPSGFDSGDDRAGFADDDPSTLDDGSLDLETYIDPSEWGNGDDPSALVDSGDLRAGFADDDSFAFDPGVDGGGGTPWTPLEGVTSIQDMLNIFMQDPEKYYTTTTVIGPDGQPITQQVMNPAAKAALQAFSVQRGAEAMETGARFGTGGPFGVIAGRGGTAQDAIGLAEQQAYAGITSPFAALRTGGEIDQISQILRGGVTAEEQRLLAGLEARGGLTATQQSDLAGLQARGGLSADEQRQLAGLQARGGLGVADQFALAGMQARGGLTPEQMRGLSGLQARGGLTPQQRMAEQRMALMPSLFQMTPQTLGGFAEVFGGGAEGKAALQGYLSPFFAQPEFTAQGTTPPIDWTAEGALTPQALSPQALPPAPGTQPEPYTDPSEWGDAIPVSSNLLYSRPLQPEQRDPSRQNLLATATPTPAPQTRQTLGGYRKASPFARGGTQAKAAIAGKDLEDYLGEVTPFGGETRRGGLGARRTRQLTY
jgi:hypothetical protein